MKSLFRGFAAFLLLVSIAFSASAKTVDMSDFADGEGWKRFSAVLVADGFMKPGANEFDTQGLSVPAYQHKLTAEQRASVNFDAFHRLNIMTNNLPEVISVDQFRRVAGNLKLPDVQVVAAAKTSTTPTTLAPAATAPQVQTPPVPVVTAENVRQQLNELSASVDGKYNGIKSRVEELKAELKKTALKSDIAKIVEETQTIINLTNRVKVVEGKVEKLELAVNHPETGLASVNGKAQTAYNTAMTASDDVGKLTKKVSELTNSVRGLANGFDDVWVAIAVIGLIALLAVVMSIVAILRRGPSAKTAAWEDRTPPVL